MPQYWVYSTYCQTHIKSTTPRWSWCWVTENTIDCCTIRPKLPIMFRRLYSKSPTTKCSSATARRRRLWMTYCTIFCMNPCRLGAGACRHGNSILALPGVPVDSSSSPATLLRERAATARAEADCCDDSHPRCRSAPCDHKKGNLNEQLHLETMNYTARRRWSYTRLF